MMAETVLVTGLEYDKAVDVFASAEGPACERAPAPEGELAPLVCERQCRAVIVGMARYEGELYRALRDAGKGQGAIVARFGVGHDNIDKRLAAEHGIVVTNTPHAMDQSVAEHAMWLLGCLTRGAHRLDARMRAGKFEAPAGIELHGRTLGVLGFGGIGRRVAKIAHFGFGMKVIVADAVPVERLAEAVGMSRDEFKTAHGVAEVTTDVGAVLARADCVSLHVPAIAETRHLINAERLALTNPGAILVNTSRGSVLDENALFDALAEGRLSDAGLDVFETEPYAPQDPARDLRTLDNVLLTPHIASHPIEANAAMAGMALENVRRFLAGEPDRLNRVG